MEIVLWRTLRHTGLGLGPITTLLGGAAWTGPVAPDDGRPASPHWAARWLEWHFSCRAMLLQMHGPLSSRPIPRVLSERARRWLGTQPKTPPATPAQDRCCPPIRPLARPRAIFLSLVCRACSSCAPRAAQCRVGVRHHAICSEENSPCDTGPGALTFCWMTRCRPRGHRPSHQACPAPDR